MCFHNLHFFNCFSHFPLEFRGLVAYSVLLPLLSLAAVLWCSGSHIYGVSEGQWGLLPGTARSCLCRRVNSRTHLLSEHIGPTGGGSETLAGSGHLLTYQQNEPGWGNSTCCTLPSLASAWSESRGFVSQRRRALILVVHTLFSAKSDLLSPHSLLYPTGHGCGSIV